MYNDFRLTSRERFDFEYKGHELVAGARSKLKQMSRQEKTLRDDLVKLIQDPTVSPSDKRVKEAKEAIESTATHREQLVVFVHEFERSPDRVYSLSIGDVVFFNQVETKLVTES